MGTRIVENEEKYEIKPNKKVAPESVAFLTGFGVIIVPIIEMVFLLLATLGTIHLGALSILHLLAISASLQQDKAEYISPVLGSTMSFISISYTPNPLNFVIL